MRGHFILATGGAGSFVWWFIEDMMFRHLETIRAVALSKDVSKGSPLVWNLIG
jgi:hypothetical protein